MPVVASQSPFKVVYEYSAGHSLTFMGSLFTLDLDGLLTGGTITEIVEQDSAGLLYTVAGLSLAADLASEWLSSGDPYLAYGALLYGPDILTGSSFDAAGDDWVHAGLGNDISQQISGSRFADLLIGSGGNDSLLGLAGDDQIDGGWGDDVLSGGEGRDSLVVREGNALLLGSGGKDLLLSLDGDDQIDGGTGADMLDDGKGNDVLNGGGGGDTLVGGRGADLFAFREVGGITTSLDFASGIDRIDLSSVDADRTVDGDQAFNYIADAAFTNTARQLRNYSDASGNYLLGDMDAPERWRLVPIGVRSHSIAGSIPAAASWALGGHRSLGAVTASDPQLATTDPRGIAAAASRGS